jgi:N-acyl-D-amino-acid deacylase
MPRLYALLMIAAVACSSSPDTSPSPAPATLIVNATVLDGAGTDGRAASVRIEGDRIVEVGRVQPRGDDRLVDGTGLVLAPGFIDTHSHADDDIFEHRDATAVVSQGITTVVVGQDGGSPDTLSAFFRRPAGAVPRGGERRQLRRPQHRAGCRDG